MKQLLLLIIISILFAAFTVQKNIPAELTQLVVTIPELTSSDLQKKLEVDFSNLGGVQFCGTSLLTKTLILKYDSKKVSSEEIEYVFRKWECKPGKFSYQKLY